MDAVRKKGFHVISLLIRFVAVPDVIWLYAGCRPVMLAGAVFPWRSDNQFRLLIDGPGFFPPMLDAIERAERRVDLELYLVEDGACLDRLLEPLLRAAARGVRVRCLFDGFGCLKMSQANRDRMTAAGVELRLYNPLSLRLRLRNLHRDHRKLLLVDGCIGYVGGTGVTDEFWRPDQPDVHWHEVMVEMTGPLLQDWQDRKSVV